MTKACDEVVVADGLVLLDGGEARLRGSLCQDCGERFYPVRQICAQCSSARLQDWEFGPLGRLYSYTILTDPPSMPPRLVGQVEFEGRARVQGVILSENPASLKLDAPVLLVRRSLGRDEAGRERVGFGFRPFD